VLELPLLHQPPPQLSKVERNQSIFSRPQHKPEVVVAQVEELEQTHSLLPVQEPPRELQLVLRELGDLEIWIG
jgi:hypothetical protein